MTQLHRTHITLSHIEHIARAIAESGLAAVPPTVLGRIAGDAALLGASPVLTGILLDPTEPEVARVRAFGRVTNVFVRSRRGARPPGARPTRTPTAA